jgi:hypothetical protein
MKMTSSLKNASRTDLLNHIEALEAQLAEYHPSSWQRIVKARDDRIKAQAKLLAEARDLAEHAVSEGDCPGLLKQARTFLAKLEKENG